RETRPPPPRRCAFDLPWPRSPYTESGLRRTTLRGPREEKRIRPLPPNRPRGGPRLPTDSPYRQRESGECRQTHPCAENRHASERPLLSENLVRPRLISPLGTNCRRPHSPPHCSRQRVAARSAASGWQKRQISRLHAAEG